MADDFGLLLKAVALERPVRAQVIAIAAEGVAHQRQVEAAALLRLPDMGHFMDEKALRDAAARSRNRRTRGRHAGWKWMFPVGAMATPLRMERPPFAPDQPHLAIIDRVAEDRTRKLDFAGGQWAGIAFVIADERRLQADPLPLDCFAVLAMTSVAHLPDNARG